MPLVRADCGGERVRATFWLLDAPDSLAVQGYRNVDGSGSGFFDSAGARVLDEQPEPSFEVMLDWLDSMGKRDSQPGLTS